MLQKNDKLHIKTGRHITPSRFFQRIILLWLFFILPFTISCFFNRSNFESSSWEFINFEEIAIFKVTV